MASARQFEDLVAWQEARKLNAAVRQLTAQTPFARDYELINQMRSAALSAMTNIAEGFDCDSKLEFARFLGIARRSAVEVQSLLYSALDAGYIDDTTRRTHYEQAGKVKAIISALKAAVLRRA